MFREFVSCNKELSIGKSADDFKELIKVYSELNFNADYSELNSEKQLICKKMSFSVDSARKSLEKLLDVELDNNKFSIIDKQDHLLKVKMSLIIISIRELNSTLI